MLDELLVRVGEVLLMICGAARSRMTGDVMTDAVEGRGQRSTVISVHALPVAWSVTGRLFVDFRLL